MAYIFNSHIFFHKDAKFKFLDSIVQILKNRFIGFLFISFCGITTAKEPLNSGFDHSKIDQTELKRLREIDKPVEKDVVGNVILGGGPIKAAASGLTAAGKALATGIVTSGTVTAAKKKLVEYKRAKKIKMQQEMEPPDPIGSSSSSGGAGSQR